MPDLKYSPDNLKNLIKGAGLTRRQVADMTGFPYYTLKNWCLPIESKGNNRMPDQKWEELCKCIGVFLQEHHKEGAKEA
jgi:hypothetical protein